MKKLILFICLSVFSLTTLNAQIKIDRSDISYAPASFSMATDTTFTLPAGFDQSGPNRSWDFSGLNAHETFTTRFLSPSAQNGGDKYQDCNLVVQEDDRENIYNLISIDDNIFTVLSNTSDSFVSELSRYNQLYFTLNYGDGWTDTNTTELVYPGSDFGSPLDSIKLVIKVSIDNNCDAWGKLNLPLGEKDVLRMRTYVEVNVKVYGLNGPSGWVLVQDNSDVDETFSFYAKKAGYWILNVRSDVDGNYIYSYRKESLVSVGEQVMQDVPNFYPNPASNKFIVDTKEPIDLKIYSLTGQLVREYHFENLGGNTVDINGITPGAYIIKFRNEIGQEAQGKLIVK